MPSPERRVAALALALGLAACLGLGAREASRRSTIPLALDALVAARDVRPEKHPGVDDSYFLTMVEGGHARERRVDRAVFDAVRPGDRLQKEKGGRTLRVGDRPVPLGESEDARGLRRVTAFLLSLAGLLLAAPRLRR